MTETAVADAPVGAAEAEQGFKVRLRNFEGPFDLLLSLINQHQLDVTEVALHTVTDDFIAYTKSLGREMGLDQTTEFLVIAATLLDLKAARLLPQGDVEDAEDLALLEARDLLFARLMQYRAYKQVAMMFGELEAAALRRYPRSVSLEERFEALLPEVMIGVGTAQFAQIAATAFSPRPVPTVGLGHLHTPKVSIAELAQQVLTMLQAHGEGKWATFRDLIADCTEPVEVVGRFLALLELYREKAVEFIQEDALGELSVSWTGAEDATRHIVEEDYE